MKLSDNERDAEIAELRRKVEEQAEAIRVLGLDVRSAARDRAVNDNWMEDEVSDAVRNNSIARASVEGTSK